MELEQDQEEQESKEEKKIQDNHENDCQGGRRDFEGEARDTPHPLESIAKNLFSPVIRLQYLLMHCRASRLKVPWRNARKTVCWPWRLCSAD